ncbi:MULTISPECIES: FusB/FusC family EF-G-binding protein [Bacillus]|uniref:Ferrous iron transporter A n=2 Tax=Bacillus TaxID=1386 RepID=A0A0M4GC75_9BACI|nr:MULTISPECIES: elongation factor G-binding protein [Bacillus]ALC83503.1 ferrous iron transporter A [Bacillus gobiensis]MBP1082476.1 hypothetical protein [Bacillus capparidis]MED1097286.1 elongation factor G-binding protein [Bacillus capparidis]
MEPFIRSDQYNFIRTQTQILINGHLSVNDKKVLHALKLITVEKVIQLFEDINDEQKQLLNPIVNVEDKTCAEEFLLQVEPYVIPFKNITEQRIKKLFPKAKKLKIPSLEDMDLKEMSYLGWNDIGSNKKYIVTELDQKLIGLQGTFKNINQKGICALCNGFEEVGLFVSESKGSGKGTFTKRGNYICQDSQKCNHNMTTLDKLHDFIERLTK